MFRRFQIQAAALALIFALAPLSLHAETPAADLIADLDRIFSDAYPSDEPGAAVLVQRGGETLLRKGYGMADLELGVAIEPDMVFRLGSITKQFTAVAILQLEQAGKLSVDDPITRHLPSYPAHEPPITIEHLLTHTSGIPSYTDLPEWPATWRDDVTVDEMIATFRDRPLEFTPGSQWRYSNSGYFLLGAIIEKVSNQTYERYVEDVIFQPLAMSHSDYGRHARVIPRRVAGYQKLGNVFFNAPFVSMTHPYAAGSLLSTVDDLARWNQALDGDTLLPAAARTRLWEPYRLTNGDKTDYGYGWQIQSFDGRKVISHGGGIHGFSTMGLRMPDEQIFVAVLSNNPDATPGPGMLARRVVSRLSGHEDMRGWGSTDVTTVADVDPDTFDRLQGRYELSPGFVLTVTRDGDRLLTQATGQQTIEVFPESDTIFFNNDIGARLTFVVDGEGPVGTLILEQRGQRIEAQRLP